MLDNNAIQPLDKRTLQFAKDIRLFIKQLSKTITNFEDCKQLARSSGSIGANYIEGNECLSEKDCTHRFRIAKKEAKESIYWLELIDCGQDTKLEQTKRELISESTQIMKILIAIINKRSKR